METSIEQIHVGGGFAVQIAKFSSFKCNNFTFLCIILLIGRYQFKIQLI